MRSAILLFALASSIVAVPSAFAAANYTNPLAHQPRVAKQPEVTLTFTAATGQMRGIEVNGNYYRLDLGHPVHVTAPIGATVRLVAQQDSKLDGTVLMQVAASDANRDVRVQ
jgi:hypothetical protein